MRKVDLAHFLIVLSEGSFFFAVGPMAEVVIAVYYRDLCMHRILVVDHYLASCECFLRCFLGVMPNIWNKSGFRFYGGACAVLAGFRKTTDLDITDI